MINPDRVNAAYGRGKLSGGAQVARPHVRPWQRAPAGCLFTAAVYQAGAVEEPQAERDMAGFSGFSGEDRAQVVTRFS
jgi:hypothetical protein